ncbi:unnamed protein product [Camellia sinensis]
MNEVQRGEIQGCWKQPKERERVQPKEEEEKKKVCEISKFKLKIMKNSS